MEPKTIRDLLEQIEALRQQIQELENSEDDDEQRYFVASSVRGTFHHASYVWASYFLDSPRLLEFYSHKEAVDAGLKPCRTCRA